MQQAGYSVNPEYQNVDNSLVTKFLEFLDSTPNDSPNSVVNNEYVLKHEANGIEPWYVW